MDILKYFSFLIAVIFLGCGGGSDTSNRNSSSKESNLSIPVAYISETILHKNSFLTTNENWAVSYSGAATLSYNSSQNQGAGGSLYVSARAHNYDGPFLNINPFIQAGKMYVIRGYIKQTVSVADNYNLMAKISSPTPVYIQFNRINISDTNWNKFRAFVTFTQAQIDNGVQIYINSDNNNNFYLDEVEIASSNYNHTTAYSGDILRISGKNIVDSKNTPITINGVNLIAYNDEDSNTNDTSAHTFMNYSYYNYDKEDFTNIKSMGFNAVRIALWYRYFEDESNPYNYKEEGFAWLDTIISWAKEAGIYVMLDMHAPQGGGFQGPSNITQFWYNTTYQNRFKALWVALATRYKNDPTVVAYDLINEPCAPTQNNYVTLLNDTISQIRTVDSSHIINVENGFSNDNAPFHLTSSNILYDFHYYDPWDSFTNNSNAIYGANGVNATQMKTLFESTSSYYENQNLPMNISEYGQMYANFDTKNSANWLSDLIDLMDQKGVHRFYFSYKGNEFGIYSSKNSFAINSPENTTLVNLLKSK